MPMIPSPLDVTAAEPLTVIVVDPSEPPKAAEPSPPYFTAAVRTARLACLADTRVDVIEGGHHLHMEQAARVAAPLRDFLLR